MQKATLTGISIAALFFASNAWAAVVQPVSPPPPSVNICIRYTDNQKLPTTLNIWQTIPHITSSINVVLTENQPCSKIPLSAIVTPGAEYTRHNISNTSGQATYITDIEKLVQGNCSIVVDMSGEVIEGKWTMCPV